MKKNLTQKEKQEIVKTAAKHIIPIAATYEISDTNGLAALSAAFHEGIKFSMDNYKKILEKDYKHGRE